MFKYIYVSRIIFSTLCLLLLSPYNVTKFQYIFPLPTNRGFLIIYHRLSYRWHLRCRRVWGPIAPALALACLCPSPSDCLDCLQSCVRLAQKELRLEQHVSRTCQLDAPQTSGSHFLRGNTRGQEVGYGTWGMVQRPMGRASKAGGSRHIKNVEVWTICSATGWISTKAGRHAGRQLIKRCRQGYTLPLPYSCHAPCHTWPTQNGDCDCDCDCVCCDLRRHSIIILN